MHKLIGFMAGVVFLVFPFMLNMQTLAAPNVKDCIDGNADCENMENDTPKKEGNDDNSAKDEKEKPAFAIDLFKMVIALIIVIGLIYTLLKFLSKRNKLFSDVKVMENLGGISVGTNKSLQLVRIGSSVYVMGVGDNVDMLQEITDEQVKQELLKRNDAVASKSGTFTSLFSSGKKPENTADNGFKRRLSQELTHLQKTRQQIIRQSSGKDEKDE